MCVHVCVCVLSILMFSSFGTNYRGGELLSFETESRWVGAEGRDGCGRLGLTTSEREFLFMCNILVLDHSNII